MEKDGPKEKARQLYESGYGSLAKVAESLGESPDTVKTWKKRDKKNGKDWLKMGSKLKEKIEPKINKIEPKKKVSNKVNKKKEGEVYINPDLTEKQRMFCAFYIQSFNAFQSAIKAGYSSTFARSNVYELLAKASIKKEINRLKEFQSIELRLDANRILNRHATIAMSDVKDFVKYGEITKKIITYDELGAPSVTELEEFGIGFKDSDDVDGTLIKKIKMGKFGLEFELEDRSKSLEFLTRYMGLDKKENDKEENISIFEMRSKHGL